MTAFNLITDLSKSSKLLAFRSIQMHHIKHRANLHASKMHRLSDWAIGQANNFTTLLDMTHSTQKRWKIETHSSLAKHFTVEKGVINSPSPLIGFY
jgi:hypothetical protein